MSLLKCLFLVGFVFLTSCDRITSEGVDAEKVEKVDDSTPKPPTIDTPKPSPIDTSNYLVYSWKDKSKPQDALVNQIPCPNGYQRVKVEKSSFADWLRHIPINVNQKEVYLHNGELKSNQSAHYTIIDIDVGKRDLQQCADAVMRLYAEYQYSKSDYEKIHFNFTSGDKVSFNDWIVGKKPIIRDNTVSFTAATDQKDDSYTNFRKYLTMIFSYAGTASLAKELKPVGIADIQIGDVFIQGGFPGHAVLVMDVAKNEAGEKIFLLAQSYMPAQDIHLLKNFKQGDLSPWYSDSIGDLLSTPEWTFKRENLKRFSN